MAELFLRLPCVFDRGLLYWRKRKAEERHALQYSGHRRCGGRLRRQLPRAPSARREKTQEHPLHRGQRRECRDGRPDAERRRAHLLRGSGRHHAWQPHIRQDADHRLPRRLPVYSAAAQSRRARAGEGLRRFRLRARPHRGDEPHRPLRPRVPCGQSVQNGGRAAQKRRKADVHAA